MKSHKDLCAMSIIHWIIRCFLLGLYLDKNLRYMIHDQKHTQVVFIGQEVHMLYKSHATFFVLGYSYTYIPFNRACLYCESRRYERGSVDFACLPITCHILSYQANMLYRITLLAVPRRHREQWDSKGTLVAEQGAK